MISPAPGPPNAGLVEPAVTFVCATAIASALYWTGLFVPFIHDNLHGAIAVVFLYAPALAGRISRRTTDYRAFGLHGDALGRALATAGLGMAIAWPLFFTAFYAFYDFGCTAQADLARLWSELFAPACHRWQGLGRATLRLPDGFAVLAISQLVVVALPEELFFRGYLMARIEERWPSRRALWGAAVGPALLASSAFFALGHFLVDFDFQRLAVFFPALVFGWMRARSGSLVPGIVFHASCNLFSDVLHTSFFR